MSTKLSSDHSATKMPDSAGAVRSALDRLLAERPLHTDGRLTAINLADEAGIPRPTVYRNHPELVAELRAHAERLNLPGAAADHTRLGREQRLREKLANSERKMARYRDERDEARQTRDAFANRIALLDEELRRLRNSRPSAGNVTSLPTR